MLLRRNLTSRLESQTPSWLVIDLVLKILDRVQALADQDRTQVVALVSCLVDLVLELGPTRTDHFEGELGRADP